MPPAPENQPLPPAEGPQTLRGVMLGLKGAAQSIFSYTLFGTFLGFGALCHDLGFDLLWATLSSILIFAGPAQVISATMLAGGAALISVAIAVCLSAIRLLPMTVALLPVLKSPGSRVRDLLLPAHFIAVSLWVEVYRLAPKVPREMRLAFATGLGVGMTIASTTGTIAGFMLAQQLPNLLGAAVLLLTPLMFLVSTARGSVVLSDRVAFILALVLAPILIVAKVDFALLIAALGAGTAGYGVHRLREALR